MKRRRRRKRRRTKTKLDAKAPLASPELTGNPTAPTPALDDDSTRVATTAFVRLRQAESDRSPNHTHDIDDVAGLETALAGTAPKLHAHPIIEVTGLSDALANKAATTHTHTTAQVAGLASTLADMTTALEGKASTGHTHAVAHVSGLQAELDKKAPMASPALTGTPTAPTAAAGNNSRQLATTAFVATAVAQAANQAPTSHSHAIADVTGLQTALNAKAATYSPALTGTPTAPTAAASSNSTQLATTAFVKTALSSSESDFSAALALKANIASPTLTGTPKAPTAAAGTSTTQLATTAFVQTAAKNAAEAAVAELEAAGSSGGVAGALSASGTWKAPAAGTYLFVLTGGGQGGSKYCYAYDGRSASVHATLTAGQTVTVTIGAGGKAQTEYDNSPGEAGVDTSVKIGSTTTTAVGGSGNTRIADMTNKPYQSTFGGKGGAGGSSLTAGQKGSVLIFRLA